MSFIVVRPKPGRILFQSNLVLLFLVGGNSSIAGWPFPKIPSHAPKSHTERVRRYFIVACFTEFCYEVNAMSEMRPKHNASSATGYSLVKCLVCVMYFFSSSSPQ